jgi:hypothetical protein
MPLYSFQIDGTLSQSKRMICTMTGQLQASLLSQDLYYIAPFQVFGIAPSTELGLQLLGSRQSNGLRCANVLVKGSRLTKRQGCDSF